MCLLCAFTIVLSSVRSPVQVDLFLFIPTMAAMKAMKAKAMKKAMKAKAAAPAPAMKAMKK